MIKVSILFLLFFFLTSCNKKKEELTYDTVSRFYELSEKSDSKNNDAIDLYNKKIKVHVKKTSIHILEKSYLYYNRIKYSPFELRGIIRWFLFDNIFEAQSINDARVAINFLRPTIYNLNKEISKYFDKIEDIDNLEDLKLATYKMYGLTTKHFINAIRDERIKSPIIKSRNLASLKFAILSLPEDESNISNLCRIVWNKLNTDVNEIKLEEIENILLVAYPEYFKTEEATSQDGL